MQGTTWKIWKQILQNVHANTDTKIQVCFQWHPLRSKGTQCFHRFSCTPEEQDMLQSPKQGPLLVTSCNFQHRKMLFHLILKFLPWNFEMVGEQFSSPSVLQEVSPTLFFKEMRSCNKSVTLSHSLKLRRWDVWIRSKAGLDTAPCTPRGGNGCSV